LDHPAMYVSLNRLGSMVIDIESNRLDAKFVRENGLVDDHFSITKGPVPPLIISGPASQVVFAGEPVAFNVTVTGTQPLAYQWAFNSSPIEGATNATLIFSNAAPTLAGNYSVTVTNSFGVANSLPAKLTVLTNNPDCHPITAGLVAWWPGDGNA